MGTVLQPLSTAENTFDSPLKSLIQKRIKSIIRKKYLYKPLKICQNLNLNKDLQIFYATDGMELSNCKKL